VSKLKKFGIGALAVLLVFGAGYGAARFTTPVKIVEKVVADKKTDTNQKTDTQSDTKKNEQKQVTKHERKHRERVTHTVEKPDGTKDTTTTVTEDTGIDQKTTKNEHQDTNTQAKQDTKTHQEEHIESEKTTTYKRPSLMITGLAGMSLGSLGRQGLLEHLENPDFVFGGVVQKRLFWNVWGGAFYLSKDTTFGLAASLQF